MTPSVSVVIATYNYGRFLAGCLESVLNQSFSAYEVVIVDDGSTDDTRDVVRPFLADQRIRYFLTEHVGQGRAKNIGIRLARAPLVAFLDADDLWLPTKLERQVPLFRKEPELGVAYTRRQLIDEAGHRLVYREPPLFRGRVLEPMFLQNFVCFSSAVVRRRVFDRVGTFDEQLPLAVDYDFWLRAATVGRFDYVDEPLVQYRVGHANLSSRVEERLRMDCRIMRRFLDEHGGRHLLPPALIRWAWADTCYHIALERRYRSRMGALPWYVRSLASAPTYGLAWQGLASLFVPEAGRRCLRRLFGKPTDWKVRVRAPKLAPGMAGRGF